MTVDEWRSLLAPGIKASMPPGREVACELIVRDGALVLVGDGWEQDVLQSGFDTDPHKVIMSWGALAMPAIARRVCDDHGVNA